MNGDLFNKYLDYKIRIVANYSLNLSKIIGIEKNKLWHKKKNTEESIIGITRYYFYNLDNNSKFDENTIKLFLNDKSIIKYDINKELMSVINYFINNNRAFEIKDYKEEIVLAASILNIANNLDIATSPYKDNKNNYRTILNNYLVKFNKIPYFMLIDDSKKNTTLLLNDIKNNIKNERRLFDTLNDKISFNKYLKVCNVRNYYLTQYNYSIRELNKTDYKANNYIYENNHIANEFVLISKDIIVITLMKLFSIRKLDKVFFLPVKVSFFNDKEKIIELNKIYQNSCLSKFIKVLIDYEDFNKRTKEILEDNSIDYYVYCREKIENNKYINKYLINKDLYEENNKIIKELIEAGKEILFEEFEDDLIDYDLLEEEA